MQIKYFQNYKQISIIDFNKHVFFRYLSVVFLGKFKKTTGKIKKRPVNSDNQIKFSFNLKIFDHFLFSKVVHKTNKKEL